MPFDFPFFDVVKRSGKDAFVATCEGYLAWSGTSGTPTRSYFPNPEPPNGVIAPYWIVSTKMESRCTINAHTRALADGIQVIAVQWTLEGGIEYQASLFSTGLVRFDWLSVPDDIFEDVSIGVESDDGRAGVQLSTPYRAFATNRSSVEVSTTYSIVSRSKPVSVSRACVVEEPTRSVDGVYSIELCMGACSLEWGPGPMICLLYTSPSPRDRG